MDRDGDIWCWPTVLMDHQAAFHTLPHLGRNYRARWRQWTPGGPVDFDPGATAEDRAAVEAYVEAVCSAPASSR